RAAPAEDAKTPPPASAADDPLAELVREVRARPEALTYAQISKRVAREIYPTLTEAKAAAIEKEWDAAVKDLKDAAAKMTPAEQVAAMNAVLYRARGLKTAGNLVPEKESPDLYFPYSAWEKKEGVCLAMTSLYLILSERAGVPARAAHAPQHIYIVVGEGPDARNVETTDGGRVFTLEQYLARNKFDAETQERLKRICFKPLSKAEVLGDWLNAIAWCSAIGTAPKPLDPRRAVLAAELCVELGPDDYNNYDTLAQALLHAQEPVKALAALQKAIAMRPPTIGPYDQEYWQTRLQRFQKAAAPVSTK
ncbi:MAG: hypothetical protein KIS92_27020, partial [Planctomycetota bacterium]|nr:hypothetical protein [Planctomycetota bacterium]